MKTRGQLINAMTEALTLAGGDPRANLQKDVAQPLPGMPAPPELDPAVQKIHRCTGGEASTRWSLVLDRLLAELAEDHAEAGVVHVFEKDEHGQTTLVVRPLTA